MKRTFLLLALLVTTAGCAPQATSPAPMPASQLCVVRHAEAFKNLDPRPEGLSEAELDTLTGQGQAQARALRESLPGGEMRYWTSPAGRARQTAALLDASGAVEVEDALRPLDGEIAWDARTAAWSRGEDLRPEGGESLADGAARVQTMLTRLGARLPPGGHAVVVTHGDIASLILGELRGTALLERPVRDTLGTGQMACLPLQTGNGLMAR